MSPILPKRRCGPVNRYWSIADSARLTYSYAQSGAAQLGRFRAPRPISARPRGLSLRLCAFDFTQRSITRTPELPTRDSALSLGGVLRMKSLKIGTSRFPVPRAPAPRKIADAYQLLAELGAVDERNIYSYRLACEVPDRSSASAMTCCAATSLSRQILTKPRRSKCRTLVTVLRTRSAGDQAHSEE